MQSTIISLWLWFPLYFLLPMIIFFQYILERDDSSVPKKIAFLRAINLFRIAKKRKFNSLENKILWMIIICSILWFIVGLYIKNQLGL